MSSKRATTATSSGGQKKKKANDRDNEASATSASSSSASSSSSSRNLQINFSSTQGPDAIAKAILEIFPEGAEFNGALKKKWDKACKIAAAALTHRIAKAVRSIEDEATVLDGITLSGVDLSSDFGLDLMRFTAPAKRFALARISKCWLAYVRILST